MPQKLMKDWILKYGVISHRRFFKKEKIRFLHQINDDFKSMGYSTSLLYPRKTKGEATNLLIGDVRNADTIIVAPYDTPTKTLGLLRYHPFDLRRYKIKYTLTVLIPLVLICLVCFIFSLFYLRLDRINGRFTSRDAVILIVYIIGTLSAARYAKGIPNSSNLNRNSSGIITLLAIADALKNEANQQVAFALTDHGCSNHMGDMMLKEYLGRDREKKIRFIILDCVGTGNTIGINYRSGMMKAIDQLPASSMKLQYYPADLSDFSSAHLYSKCLSIACAFDPENKSFIVREVNTGKDTDIDLKCIGSVIEILRALVQK